MATSVGRVCGDALAGGGVGGVAMALRCPGSRSAVFSRTEGVPECDYCAKRWPEYRDIPLLDGIPPHDVDPRQKELVTA